MQGIKTVVEKISFERLLSLQLVSLISDRPISAELLGHEHSAGVCVQVQTATEFDLNLNEPQPLLFRSVDIKFPVTCVVQVFV